MHSIPWMLMTWRHKKAGYQLLWTNLILLQYSSIHDDVIKWKHFPRYWPFVQGIHRSPVNSPHKGQWRGALMFSLICAWINGWVNNREAGDLRCHCAHYDFTVMSTKMVKYLLIQFKSSTTARGLFYWFCLCIVWSFPIFVHRRYWFVCGNSKSCWILYILLSLVFNILYLFFAMT